MLFYLIYLFFRIVCHRWETLAYIPIWYLAIFSLFQILFYFMLMNILFVCPFVCMYICKYSCHV